MPLEDATSIPLVKLAPRAATSHKGDYGRVLIIGGSRRMVGAPALAGMAALRSGAGLVTLAVPRSIQSTVASYEPSYMTLGLGEEADDELQTKGSAGIYAAAEKITAIALGPGLGIAPATSSLVHSLYTTIEQPMIVDADAINALAQQPALLGSPAGPRILTPHAGEFQRLSGEVCEKETSKRAEQAAVVCRRDPSGRTIVVLKGHQTIVSDGKQYAVNQTGNPGMATGGTGDCLTGIITALVAQGLSPWDAAR
ncbi:MAG: NAD(P)H-hydrate dehydratase, partial [Planctomycetes bacterium]|nr:NAD(P)H-hydrate dehydratase [Planctomycetota bacterium]